MKIFGIWSGHDCSYCVLDKGIPLRHDEYERFIREKEPQGDSVEFLLNNVSADEIKYVATCSPITKLTQHKKSWQKLNELVSHNKGKLYTIGHHQAHAANAFFSSNLPQATIITLDGGGVEEDGLVTACTVWAGMNNKIAPITKLPIEQFNIGGLWTRATRYIFKLQSGWPRGHQAGTVMAMASLGNPERFKDAFRLMLTQDLRIASHKPADQPKGALIPGKDPLHPYLNRWALLASESEQNTFDLAAGLQCASEELFRHFLQSLKGYNISLKNLCFAGGVTLNSVMLGKIYDWFPDVEKIYATPVPHDGGLTVGAAQYVWHQLSDQPRIKWADNFSPYLGRTYSKEKILETLSTFDTVQYNKVKSGVIVDLLDKQKILSVFGGGSESGRRALGNRSILADPRSIAMKDMINEKVKHRQWFRPFAPSILRDDVSKWFEHDIDSPYMSFVTKFKDAMVTKVPAVVHHDGTARLQTVTENDNKWYFNLLKSWKHKTGIPILLNTSFNDREPICETPEHAINCFLRTDIDYLYFYFLDSDDGLLVSKISNENSD